MNATVKTALITGCSTGIGAELAKQLLALNWKVIATARRPETLTPLVDAGARAVKLDVCDAQDIKALAGNLESLDLLVNNAGFGGMGPLLDLSSEDYLQQMHTNVVAPLQLVQALAPQLRASRGRIINISSIVGEVWTPFAGAYCSSKAAFNAQSDILAMELAPFDITVITVRPGAVQSSFGQNASAHAESTVSDASWYQPWRKAILERAGLSQQGATPTGEFVRDVLKQSLQDRPPAVIYAGANSKKLPALRKLLGHKGWHSTMLKRFGLNRKAD